MKKFFCNGKKDFCSVHICPEDCEFYDNTGGEYVEAKPTRADHIRSMTDEELAAFVCSLCDCTHDRCPGIDYCRKGHKGLIDWLKQPYKED